MTGIHAVATLHGDHTRLIFGLAWAIAEGTVIVGTRRLTRTVHLGLAPFLPASPTLA